MTFDAKDRIRLFENRSTVQSLRKTTYYLDRKIERNGK